jgi:hypothetical protein
MRISPEKFRTDVDWLSIERNDLVAVDPVGATNNGFT